jgi:hypothetical protein
MQVHNYLPQPPSLPPPPDDFPVHVVGSAFRRQGYGFVNMTFLSTDICV